jgi:hypothetical protein
MSKVIIAGSRTIYHYQTVENAIRRAQQLGMVITEVVSGHAHGVDTLGEQWAHKNNIPVTYYPANWKKHGKIAGHIRNGQMAAYADCLILVWDGSSPGSKNMLHEFRGTHTGTLPQSVCYIHQPTNVSI